MASTYKVLGSAKPSDTTPTVAYTVPAGGQAVVSTITAANLTNQDGVFSIYVCPDGATADTSNVVCHQNRILGNTTSVITIGITADANDTIVVQSQVADTFNFMIFGLEIS